jgi:hypothetical protein
VVGYAQGEYVGRGADTPLRDDNALPFPEDFTDQGGVYRVRNQEAHAWPEVYFPGYGWVEFEPTSAQIPINRPRGGDEELDNQALIDEELERERLSALGEIILPDDFFASPDAEASALAETAVERRTVWFFLTPGAALLLVLLLWRNRGKIDVAQFPLQLERGFKKWALNHRLL